MPEGHPLPGQAGEDRDQLALQVGLAHDHLVAVGEHVRGGAELAAARDDRELARGGRLAERVGHDGVGGLVDRDQPALLGGQDVAFGGAGDDAVDRLLERRLVDLDAPVAHAQQRGLVDHVGELGAAEAGGLARDLLQRGVGRERALAAVQAQDLQAPVHVGDVDHDLAVEAPGAQQRGVEDVGPVGGAHHHEAAVAGEAVHLDEDLVERLLALVVALPDAGAALAPGGVELVDEDDRGRRFAGLAEEVAHARRADADERLDEVRARQREEGRVGFAGDSLGEQRLAGARGPHEQHALGRGGADAQVFLRFGEVVADLAQLGHRLAGAGDVGERDAVGGALALLACLCRRTARSRRCRRAAPSAPRRMNSEKRQTSSRIGIRNWTMIVFVPLPDCWSTLTIAPPRFEFVDAAAGSARPRPGRTAHKSLDADPGRRRRYRRRWQPLRR